MLNTVKFGFSPFEFRKRALIENLAGWDFTYETSCLKFEIGGTEPPESSRRLIFKIDDGFFKFVNGLLDPFQYDVTFENVLKFGNNVGELLQLENLSAFVGKKVFPIIAMDAPANADVFPRLSIAVKVSSFNDIYTKFAHSPIFDLAPNARIFKITENKSGAGNGSALTTARIKNADNWSDWDYLVNCENKIASQIQFRTKFVVTTLDETDRAAVNSVKVDFSDDADFNAAPSRTFFSVFENYDKPLHTAYLLIKHSRLFDNSIRAWCCLSPAVSRTENLHLGTSNGELQTFTLPDKFIKQDTLHLEVDGAPFFEFDFDTELSIIQLKADAGKNISVSYDFAAAENWREMRRDFSNDNSTRFTFQTLDNNLSAAAVKFTVYFNGAPPEIKSYIAGWQI